MQPLSEALRKGPVALDGGLATELEAAGADLSSALWSARLLRDDPQAIVAAHLAYFRAGARVVTTASYQASFAGFQAVGIDTAATRRLLGRSVSLAVTAREQAGLAGQAWVAASVGPYGAVLADGSEYTGAYARSMGVQGLRAFHRPRLEALADAAPDVLALETVPALAEAEALVAEVVALGVPAWLSLTTVVDAAGVVRTRAGEPAEEAFRLAGDVDQVLAVGVNCVDPAGAWAAARLAASASGKPVVVYPNSGERWDPGARSWRGRAGFDPALVARWVGAGARLVGGCCRVGPDSVRALAKALGGCAQA